MTDQGKYLHACHGLTAATRGPLQLTLPAAACRSGWPGR